MENTPYTPASLQALPNASVSLPGISHRNSSVSHFFGVQSLGAVFGEYDQLHARIASFGILEAGNDLFDLLVDIFTTVHDRCRELGIGTEKTILLEHMILSHHYEPEFGSPRKPLFPEAEMLHYLDIVDAKMFDMEESLSKVEPGEFGERVWTLDNRKLYRRKF